MLEHVVDLLADPKDQSALSMPSPERLVSESSNSYEVKGYVTLASEAGLRYSGDDTSMITARETFLSRGHFAPFVEAVSGAVDDIIAESGLEDDAEPALLEVGAGTGYYLSHMLDTVPGSRGIGLDVSVPAAMKLAQCHPKVGAVVADAWARLPIQSNSIDAIAAVFAPRNAAEFARVLAPHGELVVLTAVEGHLDELREPLGIIGVEKGKVDRIVAQASHNFELVDEPEIIEFVMRLDQDSIATQIGMSPSARHIHPDILAERIATLPDTMDVTARGAIARFRRAG